MSETRAPEVVGGQLALLVADAELIGYIVTADAIAERMSVDAISAIPGVYWYMLALGLEENFERFVIRYDIFAHGTAEAFLIENCIRRLLHHQLPITLGGVLCFSQFRQSIDAGDGIQGQDDIAHRVVEIEVQPVRYRPRAA